jgi:hypothetical protein
MGRDNTHTVYAGELVGVNMALALTRHIELTISTTSPRVLVIVTDNHTAIHACAEPNQRQSGQYIIYIIMQKID